MDRVEALLLRIAVRLESGGDVQLDGQKVGSILAPIVFRAGNRRINLT